MKATLKRALISVFAVSLTFSSAVIPNMPGASMLTIEASAETVTAGQVKYGGNTFSYSLLASGNTVKLTGIVSLTEATCPLPSSVTVNGKSCAVVEIEKNFAQNANIRTISIPDSVKKIGFNFAAGAKIESVSIGKNVREIGESFCKNSPNLRSVSYSGTALQTLGSYAFEGTPFYNKPNANGAVTMGEWLIRYTGTAANIKVLNLANNKPDIHKLGSRAFYNNKKLTSVNLNGIQIIGSQAFEGCGNLSKIEDGYSLTSVEMNGFYNTDWFTTQDKNNNGTVILGRVLLKYKTITNNTADLTNLNVQYIADNALRFVRKAQTIKLPNSIQTIDDGAFGTSTEKSSFENVYLFNQKVTYSNYKSSAFNGIIVRNLAALSLSKWGDQMALAKGKEILSSLSITYQGKGLTNRYSVERTYEIIRKLYHYVGKNHHYKFHFDGGSYNYIEELLEPKGIICGDYAELYMYLVELAGINAECVGSGSHNFNVVQVGTDWFYVDTCWYSHPDLFMVNRKTVELEQHDHIVKSLDQSVRMPSEMFTLSAIPECKYTLGDVNRDGQFDIRDAAVFRKHVLNSKKLTDSKKLILSDVNKDGKFNSADLKIMRDSSHVGSRMVGDVNNDGKINSADVTKLQNYLLGKVSLDEQSYYAADIQIDGTVDSYDLVAARRFVTNPMGDVNMDGKVDTTDLSRLSAFINNNATLTNDGKERADVNFDGLINSTDVSLIKKLV